MMEIWSKEQIQAKISPEEFERISHFLARQDEPEGMNVAGVDKDNQPVSWEVVRFKWIPAESATAVLRLVGRPSLLIEGHFDQTGAAIKQVFKRTRMVPTVDYVDFQEYNRDPGSVGMLGSL